MPMIRGLDRYLRQKGLVHNGPTSILGDSSLVLDGVAWFKSSNVITEPLCVALGGCPLTLEDSVRSQLQQFHNLGLKPVFVFGGLIPPKDEGTTHVVVSGGKAQPPVSNKFLSKKFEAWTALEGGNARTAAFLFQQVGGYISLDVQAAIARFLSKEGVPVIRAPYSAAAQLAWLVLPHGADGHSGAQTQTFAFADAAFGGLELLMYGAPRVVVTLKLPKGEESGEVEWVDLSHVLSELQLTFDQFVDVCLLAGFGRCRTCPLVMDNRRRFMFHLAVNLVTEYGSGEAAVRKHPNMSRADAYLQMFNRAKEAVMHHLVLVPGGVCAPLRRPPAGLELLVDQPAPSPQVTPWSTPQSTPSSSLPSTPSSTASAPISASMLPQLTLGPPDMATHMATESKAVPVAHTDAASQSSEWSAFSSASEAFSLGASVRSLGRQSSWTQQSHSALQPVDIPLRWWRGFGLAFPPVVTKLLAYGVVSPQVLNNVTNGVLMDSAPGVDSIEYAQLLDQLNVLRRDTFSVLLNALSHYGKQQVQQDATVSTGQPQEGSIHNIVNKRWYDQTGSCELASFRLCCDATDCSQDQSFVDTWKVIGSYVNSESPVKSLVALLSHGEAGAASRAAWLCAARILTITGHILVSTPEGLTLSPLGCILNRACDADGSCEGEALLLVHQLLCLGHLDGKPLRLLSPDNRVLYARSHVTRAGATGKLPRALRLLARVGTFLPLQTKAEAWTGPIDRELAAFSAMTGALTRTLRNLADAVACSVFLRCLDDATEETLFMRLAPILPFSAAADLNSGSGGGVLVLYFLSGCSLKELASLFPQVLDVPSHLTRFLSFWDRVLTLARGHGEGAGAAVVDVGLFEEADNMLKERAGQAVHHPATHQRSFSDHRFWRQPTMTELEPLTDDEEEEKEEGRNHVGLDSTSDELEVGTEFGHKYWQAELPVALEPLSDDDQ